jgi:formylmethanofuran dehydrogenase subunit E
MPSDVRGRMGEKSVGEWLDECLRAHGHLCPGQVLGVRMSLLGCQLARIEEPRGADRKKLIVFVEIDRCLSDAVGVVTGARLGKRSLKFFDYGKAAATFHNLEEGLSYRLSVRESSRGLADARFPEIESKRGRQMEAYLTAADADLFKVERVRVALRPEDLPGGPRSRVICAGCGEGVNDGRQRLCESGKILCQSCAGPGYFTPMSGV